MISVRDEYFEPMSSPMSVKSQKRERKKEKTKQLLVVNLKPIEQTDVFGTFP